MLSRVKSVVVKSTRAYHLAGLFTLAFFAMGLSQKLHGALFSRHLLFTIVVFFCAWAACRLFTDGLKRRIRLEGVNPEAAGDMVSTFVIYLEVIKHVIGVSFTLGWIAGVMASWEFLGDRGLLLPVSVSMAVSLIAFLVTFGASAFIDHLHWPGKEDE
jgi:hypothetical protein